VLGRFEFAGELSLAGELRPVRGALALAVHRAQGQRTLVLPEESARAAASLL
jgi:magnesium chelatase family protein